MGHEDNVSHIQAGRGLKLTSPPPLLQTPQGCVASCSPASQLDLLRLVLHGFSQALAKLRDCAQVRDRWEITVCGFVCFLGPFPGLEHGEC